MIDKPGIYPGLAMEEYLKAPAVSASLLNTLRERCPRAAWHDSWLNPKLDVEKSTKAQNAGTIAHAGLLEGNFDFVAVIDPNDHPAEKTGAIPDGWTNKSIRAARDAAIANGKIPWLAEDVKKCVAMVDAAREYIDSLKSTEPAIWALFQPDGGDSEITIVWDDQGTLCRIRPDRISRDRTLIGDYKTTSAQGSAEPDTWGRTQMVKLAYYVSASFYRRGVEATFNEVPEYFYLVQEQEPPHLCSLVGIEPAGYDIGERRIARSLRTWTDCAKRNVWPAYPMRVCYPEIPTWEMQRAESEDEPGTGIPYDPGKLWKKPVREDDPVFPT